MAQAGSDSVQLLGMWSSPFVLRARVGLHLKSVTYDYLEEKDVLNDKSELLLKHNPVYKTVPVLVHGDRPVCGSLNIVQYIDEVWPSDPPILPSDPFDRATARFLAEYIDEHCVGAIGGLAGAKDEEGRKVAKTKLEECLDVIETEFGKRSKGKDFFGGDSVNLVDIAFGCVLGPLRVAERFSGLQFLRQDKTPSLLRWADKFCRHNAVKPYMPTIDKLVEFAKIKFNN
ncbi:PREDICTED: glutathione S-transferase U13-like [Tarenaya hassleriana]|uniref:glutathione S-transferase U13-like n=1 Tax=Tarenaya hassleriana TaxID=28532 RepID=UPI00053C8BBB|nr:PREDICTED: glutathione S-transferase U13-like [Tarenaya hassleriana]